VSEMQQTRPKQALVSYGNSTYYQISDQHAKI